MKLNANFKKVFQGLMCFAMLSACGKQKFGDNTGLVATNLNQFLSLSQAERASIIDQIGYDCGYTNQPTPVEGTSIIGATVASSSEGSTGQYWIEPRLCLPVCRVYPIPANLHISIASLDGAVAKEELGQYYIGYCQPPGGGCAGGVDGSSGSGTATVIAAGLSCAPPSVPPAIEPVGPIIPMPMPMPVPAVPVAE